MKKNLIKYGIIGLVLVTIFWLVSNLDQISIRAKMMVTSEEQQELESKKENEVLMKKLRVKANEGLVFAKAHDYDVRHIFLVDFSIHSGKNRFFVWDYKADTVAFASVCAHGTGKDDYRSTQTEIKYSNVEGSLCSSLGKYKVGIRSYSKWGINVHYKLHGLEKTNDNAFQRVVVLHSYDLVPQTEIYPHHLPLGYSQGCPVIDDNTMQKVDNLMKEKEKSPLLWIYE